MWKHAWLFFTYCSGWRSRHPLMSYGTTYKGYQAQNRSGAKLIYHDEEAMTNGVKNAGRDACGWVLCAGERRQKRFARKQHRRDQFLCSGWRPRHPLMSYGTTYKGYQAQNRSGAKLICHDEDATTNRNRTPSIQMMNNGKRIRFIDIRLKTIKMTGLASNFVRPKSQSWTIITGREVTHVVNVDYYFKKDGLWIFP